VAKQAKYVFLLLAAVLALAVWLRWLRDDAAGSGGAPAWGQGELEVSEWGYYMSRISSAIDTARSLGQRPESSSQGQARDSACAYLVVDTSRKELWIESDGRILPEYHTDLPPSMEWKLYRSTPDGTTGLPPFGRFRLPLQDNNRFVRERVSLLGTQGRRESLCFSFGPDTGGSHYTQGSVWSPQSINWSSSLKQAVSEESSQSIIVSDAEYEKAKAQFGAADSVQVEPAALRENRATWMRAEKRLYQEIDRRISMQGLRLWELNVTCGPDYTAASATLRAGRSGVLSAFRDGPPSAHVYLQIDSLGNNVWYAKSAPHPLRPMPQRLLLDMEFLISATGQVPKKDRPTLLAEGRRRQREIRPQSPSEWRVNLPNGVTIEFIGLCENPSGGRQWWGPDGSPLGFAPYVNYEPYGMQREDRTVYEIAWRIHAPEQGQSSIHSSFEGTVGSYGREVHDRYGNRIFGGLQDTGCAFDRSRETTTLKVGVSVDDGPFAWATLKNISLVPGKNQGFEIIPGEE